MSLNTPSATAYNCKYQQSFQKWNASLWTNNCTEFLFSQPPQKPLVSLVEIRPENITFKKAENMKEAKEYAAKNLKIYNFELGDDLELANYVNEGLTNIYNKYKGQAPMPKNIGLKVCGNGQYNPDTDTISFGRTNNILATHKEALLELVKLTPEKCEHSDTVVKKMIGFSKPELEEYKHYAPVITKLREFKRNPDSFDAFELNHLCNMIDDLRTYDFRQSAHQSEPERFEKYSEPINRAGDKFRLVYHEYGHMLHHKTVSDKDKMTASYFDFANSRNNHISTKVSLYAAHNVHEFIAETYTTLLYGEKLPKDVMDLYKKHNGPQVPSK